MTHQFHYRALLTDIELKALREGVGGSSINLSMTSVSIRRRDGLKVRRENVPKAVRQSMPGQHQWNEFAIGDMMGVPGSELHGS